MFQNKMRIHPKMIKNFSFSPPHCLTTIMNVLDSTAKCTVSKSSEHGVLNSPKIRPANSPKFFTATKMGQNEFSPNLIFNLVSIFSKNPLFSLFFQLRYSTKMGRSPKLILQEFRNLIKLRK